MKMAMQRFLCIPVTLFLLFLPALACCLEIEPFRTSNRSPLIQIFGLPAETSPLITSSGHWRVAFSQDIANSYTASSTSAEQILLDGELYRWTLSARYGISDRLELGLELPFVVQGSGFLDSFITDWHNIWGLPQGGRDTAPLSRLNYRYTKNGVSLLDIQHRSGGIADISLLAGYKLFEQQTDTDHDVLALRGQLKLPTGNSANFLGSSGIDMALFLTGSMNRSVEWGTIGTFASLGGMYTGNGRFLAQQQEHLVGFVTAGMGWSPADWISFKLQCSLTSPFYKQSSLSQMGTGTALLTTGGSLKLPGSYLLDIGISEDIAVATAPDVTFHLGLSRAF